MVNRRVHAALEKPAIPLASSQWESQLEVSRNGPRCLERDSDDAGSADRLERQWLFSTEPLQHSQQAGLSQGLLSNL
jgi:hypothetical protein